MLPPHLSTGEQQTSRDCAALSSIARDCCWRTNQPAISIPELSRDIMRLFEQFQEVGTTVIIASHERELIAAMGKPIVELSHGALADAANDSDGDATNAATDPWGRGAGRKTAAGRLVGRGTIGAWRETA